MLPMRRLTARIPPTPVPPLLQHRCLHCWTWCSARSGGGGVFLEVPCGIVWRWMRRRHQDQIIKISYNALCFSREERVGDIVVAGSRRRRRICWRRGRGCRLEIQAVAQQRLVSKEILLQSIGKNSTDLSDLSTTVTDRQK